MIGTFLKWFAGIGLCLILQTTLMHVIAIAGITPDLLILVLFLMGVRNGVLPSIYAGFLIGLGQDLYTPAILGQHALAMTITGSFVGLFHERIIRTDPIIKLVILLVAFIIHDSIFTIVTIVKTDAGGGLLVREIFTRSLPRALYSIALASLSYIYNYYVKPTLHR